MRAACDWHASSRQHKKSPLKRLDTRSQGVSSFVNSVLRKIPVSTRAADSTVHRSGNLRPFAMCLSNPLTQSTLEHVSTLRVGAHCTRARPSTTPSDSPTRHTIRFPFFMKSRAKRSLSLNQCGNLSDCAPVEYRVIISSSIAFSRTHRPA